MRFVWLLLLFGGIALAIFTNNPLLLGLGLLVALISGFCAVFAFAAARIDSTARPDSALLTPEVLAAVRARAAAATPVRSRRRRRQPPIPAAAQRSRTAEESMSWDPAPRSPRRRPTVLLLHFLRVRLQRLDQSGYAAAPSGTLMLDPLKSSPIGCARPPRHCDRKPSATALNALLLAGRAKPWPSSGNST